MRSFFNTTRVVLWMFIGITSLQAGDKPFNTSDIPPYRTCGTPVLDDAFEDWYASKKAIFSLGEQDQQYTIPVIIHIIHNGQNVGSGTNISNAQAISQINLLNLDYNKLNADTANTPGVFKPLAASTGITFCPAIVDPNGNILAESGINRINRQDLGFSAAPYNSEYIDTLIKPKTIWDPNEYLNIWVLNISGGILGYATFPVAGESGLEGLPGGSLPNLKTDGVVILYSAIGNTGAAAAPYNKGRTTTHEIGHWLGLRHIWGDANCGTDHVNDTPTQRAANYGCPNFPKVTCSNGPNGDMHMNYMDYTNDACMNMFSNDQKIRMQTILSFSPMRANLILSDRCNIPALVDANLSVIRPSGTDSTCAATFQPQVEIRNLGSNPLTSFTIQYKVDAGVLQNYLWNGSIPFGKNELVTLPAINSGALGSHTFQATLISPNGMADPTPANNSATVAYKKVSPITPVITPNYNEGFQAITFPPTGWRYIVPNPDHKWKRYAFGGGFGLSTTSIRMDHFYPPNDITGQRDILELPAINFSGANSTLRLRMDVAYARYDPTTNDSIIVALSTDCGMTWERVYAKGGTNLATAPDTDQEFIPTSNQWRKDSTSLAAYAGLSPVLMRIESLSNWGNYVYLDNINLLYNPVALAPVANFILSKDTICVGETLTLTDASTNGPTSWAWTMTGGTPPGSGSQNPQVSYTTTGTKTITLIATNTTGSSTPVNKQVVVSVKPEVAVNSATICAGKSATLTASGATSYSWNTGAATNAITVSPTALTVYTVTGKKDGCASTVNATVTVNPLPSVPTISKSGDVLTSSYSSGNQWYRNGVLIPGAMGQNYTVTETGSYTVEYTNSNNCSALSAATNVTTVGILDNTATDFSLELAPNPNTGNFRMDLISRNGGEFSLTIRNILGQTIIEKPLGKVSQRYKEIFDLSYFGVGVYYITLEKEGKFLTRKVVVQ